MLSDSSNLLIIKPINPELSTNSKKLAKSSSNSLKRVRFIIDLLENRIFPFVSNITIPFGMVLRIKF